MPLRLFAFFYLLFSANLYALSPIQHWQTNHGVRVYFIPAPELALLDLNIVFDAGSARDADKPGIARMTNAMLSEGAGGLDTDELLRRFSATGAEFSSDSGRDMADFTLRSLTKPDLLGKALDTLMLILSRPDFPASALERTRKQMLQSLEYEKQSPSGLAGKAFYKAVYGDHPYASPENGTEESLKTISAKNLRAFYERYYVARNAVISMVGAISRQQAEDIAQQISAKLTTGEPAPALPKVNPLTTNKRVHIEHPSTQTHVLMGQPAYARHDPDHFSLYVGNHILGGNGLVSRLAEQVREKRGLSYSVYSYFSPLRAAGPFIAGLQTKNAKAEEAEQVVRNVIREFIDKGPDTEELDAAKQNLSGGFALKIDSNSKLLSYLQVIGFYQLPLNYLEVWTERTNAVTLGQVTEAFKRHVDLDKMVLVTVGQSDKQAQKNNAKK